MLPAKSVKTRENHDRMGGIAGFFMSAGNQPDQKSRPLERLTRRRAIHFFAGPNPAVTDFINCPNLRS